MSGPFVRILIVRVFHLNYKKWVAQQRKEILDRVNARRDRKNAEEISLDLEAQNKLREFYFSLKENELKEVWNNGDNDLTETEREIAKIALRDKLGIK